MPTKESKLASISEYAAVHNIDRKTVYKLIEDGVISKYIDPKGNPLLDLSQRPLGIKKYAGKRKKRVV